MSATKERERLPRTQAIAQASRWPGWIWAVPIAAAAITGWLLLREVLTTGIDVTVTFDDAAGMKANDTKVRYRGLEIGSVSSVALSSDGKQVVAHLNIDDGQKRALTAGTRFYLEGARPSFSNLASLKAIVSGPYVVMVPGAGAPQRRFAGLVGEPPPLLAVAIPYLVNFQGSVGGLKPGAPVTLRGFTVGDVDHVAIVTDPQTGTITTPVVLLLDPTRFNIAAAAPADGNWGSVMNAALTELVSHGLRASLTQQPPLIGAQEVELDMTAGGEKASLRFGGRYPEIPTATSGGIENLVAQAGKLPLAQIGDNIDAITAHVKSLVSSPQLNDTLDHLDHTVAALNRTVDAAGPQVAPALDAARAAAESLRKTASSIEATADAIKDMTGASPTAPNGNLQQALNELTETGRAVRSLANYLDQHPEALLKGR